MMEGIFAPNGDGLRFVGDFARVYAENPDPWAQSARLGDPRLDADAAAMAAYYHNSRRRTAHVFKDIGARGDALEIGCGHGHAIKAYRMMGPMLNWHGADISPEAVAAAMVRHPGVKFSVLDITADMPLQIPLPVMDVVILGECLWYTLERIDTVLKNCGLLLAKGGTLVITQGFLRDQRYGREIANGFQGALRLFCRSPLALVHAHFDEDFDMPLQHGVMAFRVTG